MKIESTTYEFHNYERVYSQTNIRERLSTFTGSTQEKRSMPSSPSRTVCIYTKSRPAKQFSPAIRETWTDWLMK